MKKRDYINLLSKIIAFVLNIVINFFVSSFVIRTVGEEAYGFVGLANDFVSYAQIVTIALNSMASRFITIEYERKNIRTVNEYYSSLLIMNVLLSVIIGVIGAIIIINLQYFINITVNNVADIKILWSFIFLNLLISLVGTVFSVATFCKKRLELDSIRTTIGVVIKAIILIICYIFLKPYVWYIGMATVISSIYSIFYNIRYTRILMPEVTIKASLFSKEKIKILIKSGGWNSLTRIGAVLSGNLDLLVTNLFVSALSMGVMSVAKMIPQQLYNLIATMSTAFSPNFVIFYANDNCDDMLKNLKSTIKIFSVFTVVPLILAVTLSSNIFAIWVPSMNSYYLECITIVAAIGYLAIMPFESVWSIYTAYNKIKWSSIYLMVESFLNIGIELLLIQFMNNELQKMLVIVGVTTILMIIRALFFIPIYTKKCIGYPCFFMYKYALKNALLFIGLSCFGYSFTLLFESKNWVSLIIGALVIGIFSLIISAFVILNKEERLHLIELIKLKILKR